TACLAIAAAILLVFGFFRALSARSKQAAYGGRPFAGMGRAFLDAIGATGIQEAITGKDVATGRKLTEGEQTERGVSGTFTFLGLLLGVRSSLKGPVPKGGGVGIETAPGEAPVPEAPEGPVPKGGIGIEPAPGEAPKGPITDVEPPAEI